VLENPFKLFIRFFFDGRGGEGNSTCFCDASSFGCTSEMMIENCLATWKFNFHTYIFACLPWIFHCACSEWRENPIKSDDWLECWKIFLDWLSTEKLPDFPLCGGMTAPMMKKNKTLSLVGQHPRSCQLSTWNLRSSGNAENCYRSDSLITWCAVPNVDGNVSNYFNLALISRRSNDEWVSLHK
jgi:hypothetical protein